MSDIAQALPRLPIQIGGGIRTGDTIERYLQAGVNAVIIGTQAVKAPDFVVDMCKQFPGHIMVGLDARDGLVATDGWAATSQIPATDLAKRYEAAGVAAIIYTDIARDGMLTGVNVEATVAMARGTRIPIIASGGVHTIDGIHRLKEQAHHGISGVITGRALYEGTIDLAAAQTPV